MAFSPENLKIWVNSREIHAFINGHLSPVHEGYIHHLVPPHLTIPCLHKPPKHNVAVPINKVEGRLRGANPVRGGVRAAHHPMRGVGKGFGADGGLT